MPEPVHGPVEIGKLGKAHGLRGEVRFFPHNPESPLLRPGLTVEARAVADAGRVRSLTFRTLRPTGDAWIVSFDGVDDRAGSEAIAGSTVWIDRGRLPRSGESDAPFVWEIEGLRAIDSRGVELGQVITVVNYGAGDILVVRISGREVMLPFASPWVGEIRRDDGTVQIEPGELLEA